jgi:hypothetical protein
MMCDFLNGTEIVSFLDLIPEIRTSMPRHIPGTPYPLPLPGPPKLQSGWRGSPPTLYRSAFEAYLAGSWHDRAPGETRVHLDYAGLVTFYDTSLSNLVEARYGKDRLHLRWKESPSETPSEYAPSFRPSSRVAKTEGAVSTGAASPESSWSDTLVASSICDPCSRQTRQRL